MGVVRVLTFENVKRTVKVAKYLHLSDTFGALINSSNKANSVFTSEEVGLQRILSYLSFFNGDIT